MPAATSGGAIRLYHGSKSQPPQNNKTPNKPKRTWVETSDDDDDLKKRNHNSNGNKKQRMSNGMNGHGTLSNGHGESSSTQRNGFKTHVSGSTSKKQDEIQHKRRELPIYTGKEAIIEEIRKNNVTVLLGETGSGKTTQVPQYILEAGLAGDGMIAITQPRRVAATSLAGRVAEEQGSSLGDLVGYSVRFDEKCSPRTKIKYMTDGMIMRELLSDPLLSRYSIIIVDEAHERTLRTDLLLANLKSIQEKRNVEATTKGKERASGDGLAPLKTVIMSATLDAEKFSKFFGGAKISYVKGRQHPVEIYYSATSQNDFVDAALRTFLQIHIDQPLGDVLIFLPGQEDIESLQKSIELFIARLPSDGVDVLLCTMFSAQSHARNAKALAPTPLNTRKCILATNIAETSITIPGVRYVIDTGKCKEKRYLATNMGGGFDTLLTWDITQSSAMQRAGRAGRDGPGSCFRLYTEDAFQKMAQSSEPEILRISLTGSYLQLKCLGQDLRELHLMDKPEDDSIISAMKVLYFLGAFNANQEITPVGTQMAAFPLEPHHSRSVVASKEFGCTKELLDIIAILATTSSTPFVDMTDQRDEVAEAHKIFRHTTGDHMTILNVVNAYREIYESETRAASRDWCRKHFLNERVLQEATKIRGQLALTCRRQGMDPDASCGANAEPILRCIYLGLVHHTALLQPDRSYKQVMGQSVVKPHPRSTLFDKQTPALIYNELTYTNQVYARCVSSISKSFISSHPILMPPKKSAA